MILIVRVLMVIGARRTPMRRTLDERKHDLRFDKTHYNAVVQGCAAYLVAALVCPVRAPSRLRIWLCTPARAACTPQFATSCCPSSALQVRSEQRCRLQVQAAGKVTLALRTAARLLRLNATGCAQDEWMSEGNGQQQAAVGQVARAQNHYASGCACAQECCREPCSS